MSGRSGRRPGESGSRDAILAAARQSFADSGYDGSTIRAVARDAGVDPALVMHFFGSKDGLFAAAMELPIDVAEVVPRLLAGGLDGLGERLLRFFFGLWEAPETRGQLLAVLRSAVRNERAAAQLRGFLGQVLGRVAAALDLPDPELRATLVGSQLIGLAMARYVVRVEPVASADVERLIVAVAPTLQRYLVGSIQQA